MTYPAVETTILAMQQNVIVENAKESAITASIRPLGCPGKISFDDHRFIV